MVAPPMPMIPEEYHGRLVLMALMCYAGDPAAGECALAPFRAFGPMADMVKPISDPANVFRLNQNIPPKNG